LNGPYNSAALLRCLWYCIVARSACWRPPRTLTMALCHDGYTIDNIVDITVTIINYICITQIPCLMPLRQCHSIEGNFLIYGLIILCCVCYVGWWPVWHGWTESIRPGGGARWHCIGCLSVCLCMFVSFVSKKHHICKNKQISGTEYTILKKFVAFMFLHLKFKLVTLFMRSVALYFTIDLLNVCRFGTVCLCCVHTLVDTFLASSANLPTGLYILHALMYLFIILNDCSKNNYLRIYWTDFCNLFIERKCFGWKYPISLGMLPWQPILWENGNFPSFVALAFRNRIGYHYISVCINSVDYGHCIM